jgi:hypothetical protein
VIVFLVFTVLSLCRFTVAFSCETQRLEVKRTCRERSRPSGEWNEDDYDALAEGLVVGRIMKAAAEPVGEPWLWTLVFGHHEDRWPNAWLRGDARGGYDTFAKSGRRE